jgi:hypothetical protein
MLITLFKLPTPQDLSDDSKLAKINLDFEEVNYINTLDLGLGELIIGPFLSSPSYTFTHYGNEYFYSNSDIYDYVDYWNNWNNDRGLGLSNKITNEINFLNSYYLLSILNKMVSSINIEENLLLTEEPEQFFNEETGQWEVDSELWRLKNLSKINRVEPSLEKLKKYKNLISSKKERNLYTKKILDKFEEGKMVVLFN